MSKSIILVFVCSLVLLITGYYEYSEQKFKKGKNKEVLHKVDIYNNFVNSFNNDLDFSHFDCLCENEEKAKAYIQLKLVISHFNEAESLLEQARDLHKNLSTEEEISPLALKIFSKTESIYKSCKEQIESLNELKNESNFNFMLNYTKGNINFRVLQFFATPQTANELLEQTLVAYKTALKFKKGDVDTAVNIEILIKQEENMKGASQNPTEKTRQLLQRPGSGLFKGN